MTDQLDDPKPHAQHVAAPEPRVAGPVLEHSPEARALKRGKRDTEAIAEAIQRLKQMRGLLGDMTIEELITLKHEGHRF